jgi:exopolysaccharide biosynthesis polyprenyl glycosylphosphotransferase
MQLEHEQSHAVTRAVPANSAKWPSVGARPVLPVRSVEAQIRRRRLKWRVITALLFVLDGAMITGAFYIAYFVRFVILHGVTFGTSGYADRALNEFFGLQLLITIGLLATFMLKGLYRLRPASSLFKQFWTVASATTIAFAVFSAYDYLARNTDLGFDNQSRALVMLTWLAVILLVSLTRLILSNALHLLYRRGIGLTNLLVVGSSRLGKLMMQQIAASPGLGYRVVGFIHDLDGPPSDFGRFAALGTMANIDAVIRGNHIAEVIIALPSHQHRQILETARVCERAGADFKLVPDLYEMSLSRINVDAIEGVPLLGLRRGLNSTWGARVKRSIDIVAASSILIVGGPLWLLLALAIKLDSPGPVLFGQARVGYRGEIFSFLKFRSMRTSATQMDEHLVNLSDDRTLLKARSDPRVTHVGRLLRRASLDEIPQLINVLRGEMSLVGPRPLRAYEVENLEDWERGRFEMRPGLTGLWQVRGRSDIKFDERILMDLYYIENWSLRLDFQILLQTIPAVLLARGAY